jgi:hypothetical protein
MMRSGLDPFTFSCRLHQRLPNFPGPSSFSLLTIRGSIVAAAHARIYPFF